ncbi:MAG: hypothetical protein NTV30_01470 [Chloroflexi bacterium]|nr:hypothetical protein [Chloroflexota bacterium]
MNEIEVMEMAIAREKEANKIYNDAATKTTDPNSKQLLLWLAREEMGHVIFLEVAMHSMKNKGEWPSKYSTAADNLLSKQLEKTEIPATSELGNKPKTDIPELEVLKNAIEAEKEAEAFYQKLSTRTKHNILTVTMVKHY